MNDAQLLLDRVSDQDLRDAYQDRFTLKAGEVLDNSQKVADHLATLLAGRNRETFLVCFLNNRNALLSTEILFEGTLDPGCDFPEGDREIRLAQKRRGHHLWAQPPFRGGQAQR